MCNLWFDTPNRRLSEAKAGFIYGENKHGWAGRGALENLL